SRLLRSLPGTARTDAATSDPGSDSCLWAAEPFVKTDTAKARLAQRHQRFFLDPAAPVSGLGIAHDDTGVADRLQVAGDDVVERRPFRAGDLDDAISRLFERRSGDVSGNVIRRDGLEQDRRELDRLSMRARIGDTAEEFHELGRADDGVWNAGS